MGLEPWISRAPVHIVVAMREDDYHERYQQPDKVDESGEEIEWRVPWWWVDAGKAMMLLLLAAVDEGLGAGLFGLLGDDNDRLRELLGMPGRPGDRRRRHRGASRRAGRRAAPARSSLGSRSRTSSAGNTGSRARRRPDRRHVQPVPPFSPSARTASCLPGVEGERVDRVGGGSRRVPRRARLRDPVHVRAAADRARGRPRRARRSSTACSRSSAWRTTFSSGTSSRHIHTSPIARIRIGGRRAPRCEACSPFLEGVVRGRRVIAVGRLAQQVTGAPYVRHPSHGGAAAFRARPRERLLPFRPGALLCALTSYAENVQSEAGRGHSPLVPRRRRGEDPWAARDADRRHAPRQGQARVHPARRQRRLRHRRQRGEDPRHGEQARPEDVSPPLRLPGWAAQPDTPRSSWSAVPPR